MTDRKRHWEDVYNVKAVQETSWHQPVPAPSLTMIRHAMGSHPSSLIDVGGGASLLVDCLLDRGFQDLTVLDISAKALDRARERLASRASLVKWIEADVTEYQPSRTWEIWHDRATFHFLTDAVDRRRYMMVLQQALAAGGCAIIAAFALDGPRKCSGLDIVRYDSRSLGAELGSAFVLEEECADAHVTPTGREQRFGFYRFRKVE